MLHCHDVFGFGHECFGMQGYANMIMLQYKTMNMASAELPSSDL